VALPTFRTGDGNDNHEGPDKKPIANPDSASTRAGVPVIISVLANDTDPDGDLPLSVVGLSQPDSGKGSVSTDGIRVTYTPPAVVATPFTATFTYQAKDAKDAVSEKAATVTVQVAAGAAASEDLKVTSAAVKLRSNNRYTWDLAGTTSKATGNSITVTAATTGGPLALGTATLSPTAAGARWVLSVTTTGNGPTSNPTVTIHSALGQTITAPITAN
jgi:hypothetical protein